MRPSLAAGRLAWMACSSAFGMESAVALLLTFRLQIRRANASMTNATEMKPAQMWT